MEKLPRGIIVPMMTPLNEDESIDYGQLEPMVNHIYEGGADGLFVLGTTGEFTRLTHDERFELARLTMPCAQGRITTYLGVSDGSTRQILRNMDRMEALEPDFFVCSPPFYFPVNDDNEMTGFFTEIAKNASRPVVLYNIPVTCGSAITIETMRQLNNIDTIVGIKDSSGDMDYFQQLMSLKETRPDFTVLMGSESVILLAARLGCDGFVPSMANPFPRLFAEFMRDVENHQWDSAEDRFSVIKRMNELNNYSRSWMSPMVWRKAAMSIMGLCKPYVTRPHVPLTAREMDRVNEFVHEYERVFKP